MAQSVCLRYPPGSAVSDPENLYSKDGVLKVDFTYETSQDDAGNTLYCFVNSDGAQSPTLHVNPGDTLILTLTNLVPESQGKSHPMPEMAMSRVGEGGCGAPNMTASSVNLHYHGTNTPPICHQNEVIHTIINSGETFVYQVHFPKDEPPGLYWYHPHIHGMATAAVQGGASGALIVDGIENVNPEVAGLPQRVLIVRDNPAPGNQPEKEAPIDYSVNYVPINLATFYTPPTITVAPGEKQFWRIVNACAIAMLDLHVEYDGSWQPLKVIGLDGVPLGSQQGSGRGHSLTRTHLLVPPASRAEFIVIGPSADVVQASLITIAPPTGPDGDPLPTRTLLRIVPPEPKGSTQPLSHIPLSRLLRQPNALRDYLKPG